MQTLNFRDILLGSDSQNYNIVSYGPCQFPTLGFIVDRYKKIKDFVPEKFWSITLKYRPIRRAKRNLRSSNSNG